jgi:hypothetical protein
MHPERPELRSSFILGVKTSSLKTDWVKKPARTNLTNVSMESTGSASLSAFVVTGALRITRAQSSNSLSVKPLSVDSSPSLQTIRAASQRMTPWHGLRPEG